MFAVVFDQLMILTQTNYQQQRTCLGTNFSYLQTH